MNMFPLAHKIILLQVHTFQSSVSRETAVYKTPPPQATSSNGRIHYHFHIHPIYRAECPLPLALRLSHSARLLLAWQPFGFTSLYRVYGCPYVYLHITRIMP